MKTRTTILERPGRTSVLIEASDPIACQAKLDEFAAMSPDSSFLAPMRASDGRWLAWGHLYGREILGA